MTYKENLHTHYMQRGLPEKTRQIGHPITHILELFGIVIFGHASWDLLEMRCYYCGCSRGEGLAEVPSAGTCPRACPREAIMAVKSRRWGSPSSR